MFLSHAFLFQSAKSKKSCLKRTVYKGNEEGKFKLNWYVNNKQCIEGNVKILHKTINKQKNTQKNKHKHTDYNNSNGEKQHEDLTN